jgi:hypothetical protein
VDFFPDFGEPGYIAELCVLAFLGWNSFLVFLFFAFLKRMRRKRSIAWRVMALVVFCVFVDLLVVVILGIGFLIANPTIVTVAGRIDIV